MTALPFLPGRGRVGLSHFMTSSSPGLILAKLPAQVACLPLSEAAEPWTLVTSPEGARRGSGHSLRGRRPPHAPGGSTLLRPPPRTVMTDGPPRLTGTI